MHDAQAGLAEYHNKGVNKVDGEEANVLGNSVFYVWSGD